MIKARRIRHATMITPDVERQVDYYHSVVGLGVAHRDGNRVLMSSDSEQLSLVLQRGPQPRCAQLAFEVAADINLSAAQRWFAERGIKSETRSDDLPGITQILTLTDHEGGQIELLPSGSTLPAQTSISGVAVIKLGHVAMYTGDPQATSRFYDEYLGFRVSDWIEDSFVFMRCGFEHHTLNFSGGSERRLHHIAFELRDGAHMLQACDLLGRKRIEILWGPVRHGPGHNVAIYHRNPDGQLVEFFFDMDRMVDEELGYYDPRPWHHDRPQKPKVWRGLPRDVWGGAPASACHEFARKPAQPIG